jgi:hypothetical protein
MEVRLKGQNLSLNLRVPLGTKSYVLIALSVRLSVEVPK